MAKVISFLKNDRVLSFLRKYPLFLLLIVSGAFITLSVIFPIGDYRCFSGECGAGFLPSYRSDSFWHLALARYAFHSLPFANPAQTGSPLQGYNFLSDFIIYLLSFSGLSVVFIYAKVMPLAFQFIFPYLLIRYGLSKSKNPFYIFSLLFFGYFGSSFAYLLTLYHNGNIYGSSFWQYPSVLALQSGNMLHNMQFANSLLCLLAAVAFLREKVSPKKLLVICLLIFLAVGFKLYGGILACIMFGVKELADFFQQKKIRQFIFHIGAYVFTFLLAIVVFYDPLHSTASGAIFSAAPLAFSQKMIEEPRLLYLKNLTNARYFLYAQHSFSPRLLAIELFSIFLFFLFNFGSRSLALIAAIFQTIRKKLPVEDAAILSAVAVAFIFPLVFVQKGDWYNSLQILFFGVFLANFLAAGFLFDLWKKKKVWSMALAIIILLLTVPTNLDQIRFWYERPDIITTDELTALRFLDKQPLGTVLVPKEEGDLRITAYSGKPLYVGYPQLLWNTGIDYQERMTTVKNIASHDLTSLDFTYLYLYIREKDQRALLPLFKKNPQLTLIYRNPQIAIFRKK